MKRSSLWLTSQASMGIVQWIGVAIIIAPLILQRTSSGLLVGQVMLILGLTGLVAPLLGAIADRYLIHRQLHLGAMLCHCLALFILLFVNQTHWHYWFVALCIGLGSNLLLILNPTFAIRLNQEAKEKANALRLLFQFQMAGVVIAGITMGILHHFSLSSTVQLAALLSLDIACLAISLLHPPQSIHSMQSNHPTQESVTVSSTPKTNSTLLWFCFVLCVLLSMFVGSNMVEMGPVIIAQAFDVELSHSSFGMAAAALITLVALAPAGRWMEKHGSHILWLGTVTINTFVGVGIWLMFGNDVLALFPLSLILISIINGAWNDISIASFADEISPFGPATSQGYMAAAVSIGFSIGTYIVGHQLDHQDIQGVMVFLATSGIGVLAVATVVILMYHYRNIPARNQSKVPRA
ncbi:MFS transporter [Vibrio cionasavignyae]|uniref:MFS transporter n=1 Tax=Vibrio cionasavignyae TaxID=2910252 RepID=UPI003D147527